MRIKRNIKSFEPAILHEVGDTNIGSVQNNSTEKLNSFFPKSREQSERTEGYGYLTKFAFQIDKNTR